MSNDQTLRHIALAQKAFEQGAMGTAEANFRCAIRLSPNDPEARFGLALALSSSEKHAESLQELQVALEIEPSNPTGWILLSSLFQRLGQFEKAVSASQRASALAPTLSRPYVDIVSSRKVNGDDDALMETLAKMASDSQRSLGERVSIEYAL